MRYNNLLYVISCRIRIKMIFNILFNRPDNVRSYFNTSQESSIDPNPVTFDAVVRVIVSYGDMGWTTRGTGRD